MTDPATVEKIDAPLVSVITIVYNNAQHIRGSFKGCRI